METKTSEKTDVKSDKKYRLPPFHGMTKYCVKKTNFFVNLSNPTMAVFSRNDYGTRIYVSRFGREKIKFQAVTDGE